MLPSEIKLFLIQNLNGSEDYREGIKACCPFHSESTPSFFVFYSDKPDRTGWWYKCHGGCKVSGSLSYLLKKLKAPSQYQSFIPINLKTVSQTQKQQSIDTDLGWRPDGSLGFPQILDYFIERGIHADIAEQFGFRMDMRIPAAVMPVIQEWSYQGYVKRNIDPGYPRYTMEDGIDVSRNMWGYDSVDVSKPVFITEGIIDAACFWSLGLQSVALIGNKWHHKLELLQKLQKPFCVPDNGDNYSFDTFLELSKMLCCPMYFIPSGYKDMSDFKTKNPLEVVKEVFSC